LRRLLALDGAASARVILTSSSASDTPPTFTSASALPTSVMNGIWSSGTPDESLKNRLFEGKVV
jgi:hypothetical protein